MHAPNPADLLTKRYDNSGVPTPEESRRARLREQLDKPPVKNKGPKKKANQPEGADISEEAMELALAFDGHPKSRVQMKFGPVSVVFEARVWEDTEAGTMLLCMHSAELQVSTEVSGDIFEMTVDGERFQAMFLGVKASMGLRHSLVPVKVAHAEDRPIAEATPQGSQTPS